jgi:conserved oligomeric Golgi complex subunit 6
VSEDASAEIERLHRTLAAKTDDLDALRDAHEATKQSIDAMSRAHTHELEDAASARVQEVGKLRAEHADEIARVAKEKAELAARVSDLEGEVATLKAAAATAAPAAPAKANGDAVAAATAQHEETIRKLHEAHNLTLGDVRAEHAKVLKAYEAEKEALLSKVDDLNAQVARKAMEIQYLESDQDEHQEEIKRYVLLLSLPLPYVKLIYFSCPVQA